MNQQRDLRRAAAKAFFESLEHLEQTLETADATEPPKRELKANEAKPASKQHPVQFDLASLEDAIADIEQFIQQQGKPED